MSPRERRRKRRRLAAGAGLGIGAALGASATAEAADFTVTNLNDSGAGSLRQAITDANAAPGADRILFQSGLSGTITLTSGQLAVIGPVEVLGPGPGQLTVSGSNASRVFDVTTPLGDDVSISGLRLTGGFVAGAEDGAAIDSSAADLSIVNLAVVGNNASGFAGDGGGINAFQGSLTIRTSTVSGNRATDTGGGVYAYDMAAVLIDGSTISGNSASGTFGRGGVYTDADSSVIQNSTIAGNTAADRGGGVEGDSRLLNTIVADNTAPTYPDVVGKFDAAFSLIESPSAATIISTGPNIIGQDPKLGPLADNGGPTLTQALELGSPAIDQGQANGTDQRGAPRPFDFAGVALAGDNDADIGAYERVLCAGALVNRIGTAGDDTLTGTPSADGILGLGGNDLLEGLAAGDGLCGGDGKDKLKGGAGKDKLLGEAGKDKLKGGKGNDTLKGGPGKDVLIGGKGKDKLKGGPGKDKEKQ